MNRKPIRKILSGLLSVLMLFLLLCPAVLAEDVLPVPDYTVPTGLTAVYGDYLHSVTFPPTDNGYFAWDAGYPRCTTVGNVGTNTFLATYYPPNLNEFQTVHNIEVQIEVKKAKPVFDYPEGLTGIVGKTLADVVLPKAENGVFVWDVKSPESIRFKKEGEYVETLSFFPNDSENYIIVSGIKVTVNVISVECLHEKIGEWVSDKNASFLKDGTETRKCPDCDFSETRVLKGSAQYHSVPIIGKLIDLIIRIFNFKRF